jgi:hypothetical protein
MPIYQLDDDPRRLIRMYEDDPGTPRNRAGSRSILTLHPFRPAGRIHYQTW